MASSRVWITVLTAALGTGAVNLILTSRGVSATEPASEPVETEAPANPPKTSPATDATTEPKTEPATQPATKPAKAGPATQASTPNPNLHTVQRGNLSLDVQGDALFQPVDPYEVKISFKAYPNPLTIKRIVAGGSTVHKDEVLVEFDPTAVNWAVTGAENELAMANANLAKSEADAEHGRQADELALRMMEDAVKDADDAVKWWTNVDGPQMLTSADLGVQQMRHAVEDQQDELDQLHKMYKDEELTSATSDIVIKRSIRSLEQTKISEKMTEERRDKVKQFEFDINRRKVLDAAAEQHQNLEATRTVQAQSQAVRKANLTNAHLAVEQSTRHLSDIRGDQAQFTIKSPIDGTVIYGQIIDGVWAGGDPQALKVGDKINPGNVMMRVYTPSKMQVLFSIPDAQSFWVEQGMKAKVVPVAEPQVSYEATCGQPQVLPHGNPPLLSFQVMLNLPEVDVRIVPGMKAAVHIQAGKLENVLLIPVGAVTAGKVKLQKKDGAVESREVVLGKCDGTNVQVREGLAEGDQIVLPGKK